MNGRPRDDRDATDKRWDALMAQVVRRHPSGAFSARLVAATRHAWPAPERGMRAELTVTAGVVVTAAGLTLTPVLLIATLFVLDTGAAVEAVARGVVWLVSWMTAGVSLWDVLGRAGRLTATAMTSPAGTMVLLGGILTAWLALAGLSRVMPVERGDV